jgi:hypothetical protein
MQAYIPNWLFLATAIFIIGATLKDFLCGPQVIENTQIKSRFELQYFIRRFVTPIIAFEEQPRG